MTQTTSAQILDGKALAERVQRGRGLIRGFKELMGWVLNVELKKDYPVY